MPIYEYECAQCGDISEALQRFSDKPLIRCKNCEGRLHKLISHSSFHLKGSGWYVTDYAGKKDSSVKPTEKKKDIPKAATSSKKTTAADTDT